MSDAEEIKKIIERKQLNETRKLIDEDGDRVRLSDGKKVKNWGGHRPGAGRPLSSQTIKKRTAIEAKKRFVERVNKHVDDLFYAQLELAKGERVLMVERKDIDSDGKVKKKWHEIVEHEGEIESFMNGELESDEDNYYYITQRPANNQAIQSLLDRAFGKAQEKIEIEGGFFKANELNINIVNPEKIENDEIINIGDIQEAELSTESPE